MAEEIRLTRHNLNVPFANINYIDEQMHNLQNQQNNTCHNVKQIV